MTLPLFSHLIRKELRLQRSNLMFVAGVVMFWFLVLLGCAQKDARVLNYSMGEILLGIHAIAILPSLVLLLPLMLGATSIAGERQLDVLEWQLALPVSRAKQLFVKALMVAVLCAAIGGVLALALDYLLPLQHTLLRQYRQVWPGAYSIMLGGIGMLMSSHMRDPYRALVAAAGIVMLLLAVMHLFDPNGILWPHALGAYSVALRHPQAMLPRALLAAMLCAVLALPAFRPRDVKLRWFPLSLLLLTALVATTTLWGIRAARAIPAPPTVQLGRPGLTIRNYSPDYARQHPDLGDADKNKAFDHTTNRLWVRLHGWHLWSQGMMADYAGRLTLLGGSPGNWDHIEQLPQTDLHFISPAYRSPSRKLIVGVRTTLTDNYYERADQYLEFDIPSGSYRNFPISIGTLYDWSGQDQYIMQRSGTEYEVVGNALLPQRKELVQFASHIGPQGTQLEHIDLAKAPASKSKDQSGPCKLSAVYSTPGHMWLETFILQDCEKGVPSGTAEPLDRSGHLYEGGLDRASGHSTPTLALFYVEKYSTSALLLEEDIDYSLAADPQGQWYAKPAKSALYNCLLTVTPTPAASHTSRTYTVDVSERTTGTRSILKYRGQVDPRWQVPYPLRTSILGACNTELSISPDGKLLAYAVQTLGELKSGSDLIAEVPQWLEIHALNLESGDDRVLGGFPVGEFSWKAVSAKATNHDFEASQLDQSYRQVSGTSLSDQQNSSILPPLAWSPDGKLAVLHEKYLYLFDTKADAPTGEPTAEFTRFDLTQCLANQVAFWDSETIIVWGRYSVWKLNIQKINRPTPTQVALANP